MAGHVSIIGMNQDSTQALLGLKTLPQDTLAWIEVVRRGVPTATIRRVARSLGWTMAVLASTIDIPLRTLHRKQSAAGRLPKADSERLVRLVRVFARAQEVLGTSKRAAAWLEGPVLGLGGRAPRSLLDTDAGGELALLELGRLEHGIFS